MTNATITVNLKVSELHEEIVAYRNIITRNLEAKHVELTEEMTALLTKSYKSLRKAELELMYAQLVQLRDYINEQIAKQAEKELAPMFDNDVQAQKWSKETGMSVPAQNIRMRFSEGNKKLKDSKVVSFYQWNITSVISCPWRTEMCEKACYALKAEKMYPTVATRRELNFEFSKSIGFVPAMIEQIQFELDRKKNKGKTIFFRIHESGDFFDYGYLLAWHTITRAFTNNKNIVFMAYTKSLPLVKKLYKDFGRENVNIKFMASEWADTKEKFKSMRLDLGLPVFTAVDKGTMKEKNYFACPSSEAFKNTAKEKDCGACGMCYRASIDTAIEIH